MIHVEPHPTPRFTITKKKNGALQIVLPPPRDVEAGLFYGFVLIVLTLAGAFVCGRQLLPGGAPRPPLAFTLAWLAGETLVGGFTLFVFLWNLMGREVLTQDGGTLKISRLVGACGISRVFRREKVRNLRPAPRLPLRPFNAMMNWPFYGVANGSIAFEYEYATHRFGAGIDEQEARQTIAVLQQNVCFGGPDHEAI